MFRYLTPGIVISLRDAITGMMVLSDNVCTKMVFERLTSGRMNSYCQSIGMVGTHHRFLIPPLALSPDHSLKSVTTTTARDQMFLLQSILDAQVSEEASKRLGVSQALSNYALQTLKNQILRYAIPSRLPFGTVVAHKGGTGKRGRMNAGIVYDDGQPLYIITAFTDQVPQEMPDGTPGYTVSLETIGRLFRASAGTIFEPEPTASQQQQEQRVEHEKLNSCRNNADCAFGRGRGARYRDCAKFGLAQQHPRRQP